MVRKKWVVQYNRTVTVRIGHVTIRTDHTNLNTPCPDVIMRCTLRMCSEYGLLATPTFCMERTILELHALNGL